MGIVLHGSFEKLNISLEKKRHIYRNKASMPWVIGALLILSVVAFPLGFILTKFSLPQRKAGNYSPSLLRPRIYCLPSRLPRFRQSCRLSIYRESPLAINNSSTPFFVLQGFTDPALSRSLYTLIMLVSVAFLTLVVGVGLYGC